MCPYHLQRADVLALVSGYFVVWTCRVRQGKSTPHHGWTIKRTQTDRNYLSSTKNWGLLVLAPLLHSSEEKSFFTEIGLGLTMQKMMTYSCRIGLVNPFVVPFTVRRVLNFFEVISCFMDNTFNTCIELGIWLELVVMDFTLDKSYLRSNHSLSFTFLLTSTFLKRQI